MTVIQPIASSRISSSAARDRITAQIQAEQRELFRLQNQLSTGRRIFLPSDDASSAQRALVLQRTIERKEQSLTNLQGTKSSLASAEVTLANITDSLNSIRADALGVIGEPSDADERDTVVELINQTLNSLIQIGNSTFVGSHLFSGGESSIAPYVVNGRYVEYLGGEVNPQTFVDLGFLYDTATSGDSVLGGLSEAIRGEVDLNPQLMPNTRLAQINGGAGISPNASIEIVFEPTLPTEPSTSSVIDLSTATTLADVARLIENGAPEGTTLYARVSGQGLSISASDGGIIIREVVGGNSAADLGLPVDTVALPTQVGSDLNPVLLKTDSLSDLVGVKSRGRLELPGLNNDITIAANANGTNYNNLTIDIVDGATVGSEFATYDLGTNTLTVTIDAGESTGAQIAAAINAEGTFSAATDYRDAESAITEGGGTVPLGTYAGVTDNAGVDGELDLTSGLQVVNGDETYVIDTSTAETVEDLLNLLNNPEYGLLATTNASGTGIDVRSRRSGVDFAIGENGGTTATELGIRTYTGDSLLSNFNRGVGVILEGSTNDLTIETIDGGVSTTYDIDLSSVFTVDDLINAIETQTGGIIDGSLVTVGNGVALTGTHGVSAGTPSIGTTTLGGDTLTFTALTNDPGLDLDFTIDIIDSGGLGAPVTTIVGNTITVDLLGGPSTSDAIASSIDSVLTTFSVVSDGTSSVSAPVPPQAFSTTGGSFPSAAGTDTITISGSAAKQLGFVPDGQQSATTTTGSITSTDRHTYEVDSVFNTLIRLRDALENDDIFAAGPEVDRIVEDITRANFGRAEIGSRLQNLDAIEARLEDETIDLREALSLEIDADLTEVITDLTAQQFSLQASLQTAGQFLQLSLFDYI